MTTCVASFFPECVPENTSLACKEGHDRLYTAYVVEPDGTYAEVSHLECPSRTNYLDACPLPIQRATLTFTGRSGPLCPGQSAVDVKTKKIADDDGCQLACAAGDALCCSLLASKVGYAFNWTTVSDVTSHVTCTHGGGCSGTTAATNRGTGTNQLGSATCTLTWREEAVDGACDE